MTLRLKLILVNELQIQIYINIKIFIPRSSFFKHISTYELWFEITTGYFFNAYLRFSAFF